MSKTRTKDKVAKWYRRNRGVIRWGTMIGSWILGAGLIFGGVSAPAGIAIIAGGSAYGRGKETAGGLRGFLKGGGEKAVPKNKSEDESGTGT